MSHLTLKRLAVLGALSLGGLSQTTFAQWMPFGGGCGCAVPQVPPSICGPTCAVSYAPPQPQFVMQPFTETKTVERVVQRPIYETKYVDVPQTEYRQEVETRLANVPTCSYRNVTEYQTRQRDCGRWVTNYRYRPFVAPCAYDNRPGLFGMMNRTLYQARMAVTPAVVAERSYVPNVITEQIPVTRQVAVPGVRQVSYQIPRTVAFTTSRKVAVSSMRMVAERVQDQVQVTTMRMVPFGSTGMAYGQNPAFGTAAVPDPLSTRTANRLDGGPVTPAAPIPPRPRVPANTPLTDEGAGQMPPPVNNSAPKSGRVVPPRAPNSEEVVEEVAAVNTPVRHSAGYRPVASSVQTVNSTPSIVRVAQMARRPNYTDRKSDVTVAANRQTASRK